jgi:hypothetical protein
MLDMEYLDISVEYCSFRLCLLSEWMVVNHALRIAALTVS